MKRTSVAFVATTAGHSGNQRIELDLHTISGKVAHPHMAKDGMNGSARLFGSGRIDVVLDVAFTKIRASIVYPSTTSRRQKRLKIPNREMLWRISWLCAKSVMRNGNGLRRFGHRHHT